jgi:hypothetical protein
MLKYNHMVSDKYKYIYLQSHVRNQKRIEKIKK